MFLLGKELALSRFLMGSSFLVDTDTCSHKTQRFLGQ
jgi:hypothetical protein